MDDREIFQVYNLADHHGWTIKTVLDMTQVEYDLWWEYHARNGDLEKAE